MNLQKTREEACTSRFSRVNIKNDADGYGSEAAVTR